MGQIVPTTESVEDATVIRIEGGNSSSIRSGVFKKEMIVSSDFMINLAAAVVALFVLWESVDESAVLVILDTPLLLSTSLSL